jgi:hypothetical protein
LALHLLGRLIPLTSLALVANGCSLQKCDVVRADADMGGCETPVNASGTMQLF